MKRMSAYQKDIWRSIGKSKKRFFAIVIITFLGTMMFSGLKAACEDLRYSADKFFDEQRLFDLSIMSTLGLTEEDIAVLENLEAVEAVEGVYSEQVQAHIRDNELSITLKSFYQNGLNQPYVLEGYLPEKTGEAAITEKLAKEADLKIGDTFRFSEALEEDEEPSFLTEELKVTAIIIDTLDVNNAGGTMSFRSASTEEDMVYILPENVDSDIFTTIYMTLKGSRELFCYSSEYTRQVEDFTDFIEAEIKEQRTKARTESVKEDAYKELEKAEQEIYEELEKAEQELIDGEQELADKLSEAERKLAEGEDEFRQQIAKARAELLKGEQDIQSGLKELEEAEQLLKEQEAQTNTAMAEARQQLLDGYVQLEEGQSQIDSGRARLVLGKATLDLSKESLKAQEELDRSVVTAEQDILKTELASNQDKQSELQGILQNSTDAIEKLRVQQELSIYQAGEKLILARQQALSEQSAQLDTKYAAKWAEQEAQEAELLAGDVQLKAAQAEIDNGRAQLDAGLLELEKSEQTAEEQFAAGRKQIADGFLVLESGKTELIQGWAELESGRVEGEEQLEAGRQEYEEGKEAGEEQLEAGRLEFEGGKAEAEEELANARKELADMDVAEWYLQNRNALSGYNNIKSDADSIESIAEVFPILFFVVAILISLTTITRMVEEDRGLIGTYKAMGFHDGEIRRKYLLYAFCASAAGSILGTLGAFVLMPAIICYIFSTMYLLPGYILLFEPINGLLGPTFFIGGIVLATIVACHNELVQMPVTLMRPKIPRSGSRVVLENFPSIWNRMSFLNKVTARNLFRYKKRLFMTIFGIMGCMALLLFGFAIKDSVVDLVPRQYEQTFFYDAMIVAANEEVLEAYLDRDPNISEYLESYITYATLENKAGKAEAVQFIVFPENADLEDYLELRHTDGKAVTLEDGEIMVTQNAAILLELKAGSSAVIQTLNLEQAEVIVTDVVENYLSNYVYMTQSTYEECFGEYEVNAALAFFSEECRDQVLFCSALGKQEGIMSCVSTAAMKEDFSDAFTLINMVVYIIIIMAACLAFVVLFTLATTNISERIRELATIKVLGFYDGEVHSYVNKETMILTSIGILCGIPLGWAFAQTLTGILTLPSMYLAVSLHPISYFIAAGLSFVFALTVNMITDKSLNTIDPVEALKSVE